MRSSPVPLSTSCPPAKRGGGWRWWKLPTVGYASAGGLRDSIDDGVTGLLVSDPIELQAALQRLLIDDAFRAALGSAAQLKAQDYSWEETGRRFADTLEAMGEVPSLGNQMV